MFINPRPPISKPDHECEYSKSFADAYYDKLPRVCTICGKPEKSCKSCKFQDSVKDDLNLDYLYCKYCKHSNRYYVSDHYQEKK